MPNPTAFLVLQNPDCNDGAASSCVLDSVTTGNAAPNDCQPQPYMDFGNGGVVYAWDQIDNTDLTLTMGNYTPVTAAGRRLTRHRMTWDSDNDNIAHPQEDFSVSFNAPTALPFPLKGVIGVNLLCSGATPGVANVTVTSGSLSNTFPVDVRSGVSLSLDMDITNGTGLCDPIDASANANIGPAALKVGVCLLNPLGTIPVAGYTFNVTYNDTIVDAPEVTDVVPAMDDNPDANDGATVFTSPTYPNELGDGWTCDGSVGSFPQGDNNTLTGAGNGNAYSGGCMSGAGPYALIEGPLGVITFDVIGTGSDTLAFGESAVTAEDLSEIGSCNQLGDTPMACVGGSVTVGGCPGVPNTDQETRPNGPNIPDDDVTWPEHDTVGDLCDLDDDNDGLPDVAELTGTMCGGTPTLPIDVDTDGDRLVDGWECANGSSPTDPMSKYMGPGVYDLDGDHVPDTWEARGYGASGGSTDSDTDGCGDMVEIGSSDGNRVLDDGDRLATSRRALGLLPPDPDQDYVLDMNKNGHVDDSDRLFAARAVLLPDWLPKSCP
jgi:hypothetical protein